MAVDTTDANTNGEQELFVLLEIHSYNGIALLGCLTYSGEAVALVERNLSLCILETDDFVSRQRMAAGTTLILHLWTVGEETAQTTLCLIGKHMVLPICFWYSILCSTYLYTIATMEHRLDRGQLTIDTCIHGMKSNFGMNFEGKIECSGILGQYDTFAFGCESHNVIMVERCRHTIHIVHLVGVVGYILEHSPELFQPCLQVFLRAFSSTAKAVVAYHTFRRDMHFLPLSLWIEKLHMETLVAVLLRGIDIIDHRTRTLLETVGQYGIDMQALLLFLL